MHTDYARLCFVVIGWQQQIVLTYFNITLLALVQSYYNHTVLYTPVPVKHSWIMLVNRTRELKLSQEHHEAKLKASLQTLGQGADFDWIISRV